MTPDIYLYAVVRVAHIPSEPRAPQIEDDVLAPFQSVVYRDLTAIIEPLSFAAASPRAGGDRRLDPAWIRARVLNQAQIHAGLAGRYAVLPAEFGTMFTGRAGVAKFLAAQYAELSTALDQIAGFAEWGVRVFCDQTARRASRTPRAHERSSAHRQTARVTEIFCAQDAEACHLHLLASARAATIHPLEEASSGRRVMLNAAYLVDRDAQATFSAVVAALEQQYAPYNLCFEVTGPWPPALRARAQCTAESMLAG